MFIYYFDSSSSAPAFYSAAMYHPPCLGVVVVTVWKVDWYNVWIPWFLWPLPIWVHCNAWSSQVRKCALICWYSKGYPLPSQKTVLYTPNKRYYRLNWCPRVSFQQQPLIVRKNMLSKHLQQRLLMYLSWKIKVFHIYKGFKEDIRSLRNLVVQGFEKGARKFFSYCFSNCVCLWCIPAVWVCRIVATKITYSKSILERESSWAWSKHETVIRWAFNKLEKAKTWTWFTWALRFYQLK